MSSKADKRELNSPSEDGSLTQICEGKENQLTQHNSYNSQVVKNMEELTRELRNITEGLKELRAKAEQSVEELRRELQNSAQTIEELKLLREPLVEQVNRELAENGEGDLIGSTECKKGARVDNTKRPLFKRIKGLFSSSKSKKKKKKKKGHSTKHEVDDFEDVFEVSSRRQRTQALGSKAGSEVSFVDDVEDVLKVPFRRQRTQALGSKAGSEVSFGITFTSQGSAKSLTISTTNISSDYSEDSDKEVEPIKIIEHPQSQTAKEGSKVELICKAQGKRSALSYHWHKDDGSELGEDKASLVLESVKLRDFGSYTCYVGYIDTSAKYKKSSPAMLDIIPQNLNGMRPKLLQELNINTRDEIASLLENKEFSVGGCRQIAATYDMKEYQIKALNNSKKPGEEVIEFLMASKPNLTVYNFCKVLAEIKRFDIVEKLKDHFLILEGNEGATSFLSNI